VGIVHFVLFAKSCTRSAIFFIEMFLYIQVFLNFILYTGCVTLLLQFMTMPNITGSSFGILE